MADVDLEKLAAGYSHRPASRAVLAHASGAVAGLAEGSVAIDVGGGRGDHAAVWAEAGIRPVVVDLSPAMAAAAAGRQGVLAVVGSAQQLPIASGAADLVYFHLSIHYGDWRASLSEAGRVIGGSGRCVVWTLGERHHRASMLARWFPSVGDIDARRFPEAAAIASFLEKQGWEVSLTQRPERVTRVAREWVAAVEAGFVSTLQLLSSSELDDGIAAFRQAHPDPDEIVSYQLDWDRIVAVRPAAPPSG